ncbi:hypothetical protein CPB83DRAFT_784755 [Crepidotus variabilis]|uniref:Uncharacterized protein n=1 Tax=Crepidotus variabilis TaxID=179855 RepID=A0A9P6JUN7_9AGAR|nr:hypothetical protein CPB83DRAFT_784755 [Crepidotus variabilis]
MSFLIAATKSNQHLFTRCFTFSSQRCADLKFSKLHSDSKPRPKDSLPRTNLSSRPLREFFNKWSTVMVYDPSKPATSEFHRLSKLKGWKFKNDKTNRQTRNKVEQLEETSEDARIAQQARQDFRIALTKQFNCNYGKDENSRSSWRLLCENVRISPIPDKMEEARKLVKATHVNLVDLTDMYNQGRDQDITIFPTVQKLRAYTIEHERYFPLEVAHAGGVLKHLLRHILTVGSHQKTPKAKTQPKPFEEPLLPD